jgi:transcription elongation factor GreA
MSTTKHDFARWITLRWREDLLRQVKQAEANADAALVAEIEQRLRGAVVVAPEDMMEGRVQFGSRVTVFSLEEEEEQSFQIVSSDEATAGPQLLDQRSPLAQALIGAREGQVVRVILGNGSNCDYEVTHIRLP